MIENTSARDPHIHLLGAMSDGLSSYITDMESAGQQQLVASQQIPIKGSRDLEPLGFVLGDGTDDLFRAVTLPDGWTVKGSDHAMWSHVLDTLGRERVAIFYKAAFYDRKAFCRVVSIDSYVHGLLYSDTPPVLDDEWATADAVRAAAQAIIDRTQESLTHADGRVDADSREIAAEYRTQIAKAQALIAQVTS